MLTVLSGSMCLLQVIAGISIDGTLQEHMAGMMGGKLQVL